MVVVKIQRPSTSRVRGGLPSLVVAAALATACSTAAPAPTSTGSPAPSAVSSPVASTTPSVAPSVEPSVAPSVEPSVEATPGISGDPQAPDSHVTVKLAAVKIHYAPTELQAPADKVWHVKIDNQDAILHNFALQSGSQLLFKTDTFGAGTQTFDVPGLPAGTYLFLCTIHPSAMRGSVVIK
jgi:plastocyanin